MTDFELAMLFREYYDSMHSQYLSYVSILFAFLVSGYLVAAKLSRSMVILVVAIFSAFSFDSMLVIYFFSSDVESVSELMRARIAAGETELIFHLGSRSDFAAENLLLNVLRVLAILGSYVGAIVFFFHERHFGGHSQQ